MVEQERNEDPTASGRRSRRRRGLRALALGAVVATAAAGCSADWDAAPIFDPARGSFRQVSTMRPAEDCDDLVEGARATLEVALDSTWSDRPDVTTEDVTTADDMENAAGASDGNEISGEPVAPAPPSTTAPGPRTDSARAPGEVIGTNLQEAEVDEADIVKTDGRRIVTLTDGVLRVVSLDGSPAVDGLLDLRDRATSEMFLRGDQAVVIGSASGWATAPTRGSAGAADRAPRPTLAPTPEPMPEPEPEPAPFPSGTAVTFVSLEDPAAPRITESATIEGGYVSARMVADRVSLVVRSEPEAMTEVMTSPDEASARRVVGSLRGESLLPRIVTDDAVEALGSCDDVMLVTAESSGSEPRPGPAPALSTITAVSIGASLDQLDPVTIQGAADTVYASTEALYVAAGGWDRDGSRTDIHRFDLLADGPATYTGSGVAPGRLLNQFALSERAGALRVVTTVDSTSGVDPDLPVDGNADIAIAPAFNTEARLTVLDTEGESLDEIGHLDGLGVGEEVKSVRFVEELGYVVTFRTTDPLYALDLGDPTAPRVLGELKIPGFSEYLHPIGEGLLLGVGRQADPQTGMDKGFKVSLFDISDPAAMAEVDQIIIDGAFSPVGSDHKAFMWDPGRHQSVIPVQGSDGASAMVVRVADGRLERVADLRHGEGTDRGGPIRAFVVDADLWSLSPLGLGRTSADAPGAVELLRF